MRTSLLAFGLFILYGVLRFLFSWHRNIAKAKRSGLPYIITPLNPKSNLVLFTHKLWLPVLRRLPPHGWWEERIDLALPNFAYRTRTRWFKRYGSAFLIVTPNLVIMQLNNPEAIYEMAKRRDDFPKWIEAYGVLRQFGQNIVTTEAAEWRVHRRATAGEFNERNTALVFREAIVQTQGMINQWTNGTGARKETLHMIQHDTMRVALHIICYVGFGLRLLWPKQSLPTGTDAKLRKYASLEPAHGYRMSFFDSVANVLERIHVLLFVPKWLLRLLPYKFASESLTAYEDYDSYVNAMLDEKLDEIRNSEHATEGMDLMRHLAQTTHKSSEQTTLSRSEITGNSFIMMLAGHETTANIMTFAFAFLACNPSAQRQLQQDLDSIVGQSKPETWDYEKLINPLTASMLGASMYETMRLVPGVPEIPKFAHKDQQLVIDGHQYTVPASTTISLNAIASQQDEKYWPTRPSKITPGQSDIFDFVPSRWFQTMDNKSQPDAHDDNDSDDFGGYQGPDTNAQLFRPTRGSFIIFSEGARACLGRRIAQVEVVAVLAVLFKHYSLELAVDKWASDEQVSSMSKEELANLYETAQAAAREVVNSAAVRMTLKPNGDVPLRLVKRGEERFVNWKD